MIEMSPRRIFELANSLAKFNDAYIAYLESTMVVEPHGRLGGDRPSCSESGSGEEASGLREEVLDALPAAQNALSKASMQPVMAPPPALGGPVLRGLANVAFAHENFVWAKAAPNLVLDSVRVAFSALRDRAEREMRRRRNPLYWVDRVLRAVLGIPAYLVSLILGVPRERIEGSWVGTALRLISIVADIGGIIWLGRVLSVW